MRYVLDTGAVLALLRGHPLAVTRLDIAGKQAVSVPQPVCAAVAYCFERLPSSDRKKLLEERWRLIRGELPCAPWTDEVSDRFGAVKAALERGGDRPEDFDVAVAAHALAVGAVLVTTRAERISGVPGLEMEDWTTA